MLALAAIHFGQAGVSVGIAVFAAQIIKQLGLTNMQTGFTTAIPYAAGHHRHDRLGPLFRSQERAALEPDRLLLRRWRWAACSPGCAGGSYWSILGLSLATIGLYASNAHLFPLPAVFLTGPALASGIAWVNSVGILAAASRLRSIGWIKDATGSFERRALPAGGVGTDGGDHRRAVRARDGGEAGTGGCAGGGGVRGLVGRRIVAGA